MQSILVTGASSGFGNLTVKTLAGQGHVVFAGIRDTAGRNAAAAQALAAEARAAGWKLHVLDIDVTDDASVRRAVDQALAQSHLDVVVNNAGFAAIGLAEGYTDDQARAVFETNFFGVHRLYRAALPHLRARQSGLFITVSTTMAQVTLPFAAFYTASKRALEGLVETYRYELGPLGIDSVILEAGPFPTPGFTKLLYPADTERFADYGFVAELPQKVFGGFAAQLQGPGAPNPQEVADAIAALIAQPAGTRPLRTVLDHFTGAAAETLNTTTRGVQQQVLTGFGMGDLLGVKPKQ